MTADTKRPRWVTILSALLALVFLAAGTGKLLGAEEVAANFTRFGFGMGFMRSIGAAEVAGAIGLFLPRLAPLAAGGLTLVMIGAVSQHLQHDPITKAIPAAVLLALCAFMAWSRRNDLLA